MGRKQPKVLLKPAVHNSLEITGQSQIRQGYQGGEARGYGTAAREEAMASSRSTLCGDLTGRLGITLEGVLAGLPEGSVSLAQAVAMVLVSRLLGAFAGSDPAASTGGGRSRTRRNCSHCSSRRIRAGS